jgi:hypothetical protein
MEQSNSTSSDESVKKYGQFVRKEDIRISYDYAVDYSRKDKDRALPEFRKREHKKISIRGAAERQAARERGDGLSEDEQDKAEDDGFEYRPKPVEPRGWGTYRRESSSEDDDRGEPAKDLKDEWSFDDIEEPAPPKSNRGPESESSNGRVVGGGEYGKMEYDESAPGWVPNITRREDPNLSREEKSMQRFKEATAALEATPYVPDYIPANEYVAPHLKFSRELAFPEPPPPEHWAHEKEEDQSRQQQRVSLIDRTQDAADRQLFQPRPREQQRDPAKNAYYTNPGGGYGIGRPASASGSSNARDEPWIRPRQHESIDEMDIYRASWENQRRGVAGRFNARNRGM